MTFKMEKGDKRLLTITTPVGISGTLVTPARSRGQQATMSVLGTQHN